VKNVKLFLLDTYSIRKAISILAKLFIFATALYSGIISYILNVIQYNNG